MNAADFPDDNQGQESGDGRRAGPRTGPERIWHRSSCTVPFVVIYVQEQRRTLHTVRQVQTTALLSR